MTLPTLDQVKTVVVIGTGTMGHGVAHVAALTGAQVHLYDALAGGAQAAIAKFSNNFDQSVECGKVVRVDRDAALARVAAFDEQAPLARTSMASLKPA